MSEENNVQEAVQAIKKDSAAEIDSEPSAATGKCVVSMKHYSDCVDGITKSACDAKRGYGITTKWTKDGKC